jgi:hypothetical protein
MITKINQMFTNLNKRHDGQPHLEGKIRQRSNLTSAIVSLSAIQMGLDEVHEDGSRFDDKPGKKGETLRRPHQCSRKSKSIIMYDTNLEKTQRGDACSELRSI